MRAPSIIMPRVRLVPYTFGDLENIFRLCRAPETSEYALWEPHRNRLDTLRFILWAKRDPSGLHWCVRDLKSGKFVGTCSLINIDRDSGSAELGYSVCKPFWGNGYASEMCRAMIRFGFEKFRLEVISARIMRDNRRSLRVAEKLGFVFDGDVEQVCAKGLFHDVQKFYLTRQLYRSLIQKIDKSVKKCVDNAL